MSSLIQTEKNFNDIDPKQIIYLDFDGAETQYNNKDLNLNIDVKVEDSGLSQARENEIIDQLNRQYADKNIIFVSELPTESEFSTIYVGATNDFDDYGEFYGVAETVDAGNINRTDDAFVLLDQSYSNAEIISVIDHEAKHIVDGAAHNDNNDLSDYALQKLLYSEIETVNVTVKCTGSIGVWHSDFDYWKGKVNIPDNVDKAVITVTNNGIIEKANAELAYGHISVIINGHGCNINTNQSESFTITDDTTITIDPPYTIKPVPKDVFMIEQPNGLIKYEYYYENAYATTQATVTVDFYQNIPIADLKITASAFSRTTPDTVRFAPSESFSYSFVVQNAGDLDADASKAYLYVDGQKIKEIDVKALAAGESAKYTYNFSAGSLKNGSHKIFVRVDGSGVINENSEKNNDSQTTDFIIEPAKPDLAVKSLATSEDSKEIMVGQSFTVTATVENRSGNKDSVATTAVLYVGNKALKTFNIPVISVGKTYDISYTIPAGTLATGTTEIKLILDPANKNAEFNETNNSQTVTKSIVENNGCMLFKGASVPECENTFSDITLATGSLQKYDHAIAFKGGTLDSFIVSSGGKVTVSSGGTANDTIVRNKGNLYLFNGGVVNNTVVSSGGSVRVSKGGTANNTSIYYNGSVGISSGGMTSNTVISSGGYMSIYSKGIANSTTVNSAGRLRVSSGGSAVNTEIFSGGTTTVFHMGAVSSSIVNSSGILEISSGGVANSTTVNLAGNLKVLSGGIAIDTRVASDAHLDVRGSANRNIISGGTLFIYDTGISEKNSISSGYLYVGGAAKYTSVFSKGSMTVDDGSASYTSAYDGGKIYVNNNGSMYGVNLYSTAKLYIKYGGTVNTLIFNERSYAYLSNGGTLINATVQSNGHLTVYSGGKANKVTVKNGGYLAYSGGTCYTELLYGGTMSIESGAVCSSQIASGGRILVWDGGTASGCITKSGGMMQVHSGGSADDTKLMTNGSMYIHSGGTATDTVTSYGARVHVSGGGIYNTNMQRGTITSVYQGGIASLNKVDYGSYLMVDSGATTYDTVVSSGGGLTVMSGAVAEDTVNYGTLTCNNGGTLLGETVIHGRANLAGNAIVTSNTAITFDVSGRAASAMQESYREAMLNSYYVAREADMTISVSADQASGSYILANWALEAKKGTFTLEVDGTEVGTFSTTKSLTYDGKTYSLYCFDDSTNSKALTLKVCNATARDAWTDLGTGDFDGDGIEESLVSDGTNLYAASEDLWLGNLSGTEEIASITDYNNDGTDDILIHNTATDQMTAWLVKDGTTYSTLAIA